MHDIEEEKRRLLNVNAADASANLETRFYFSFLNISIIMKISTILLLDMCIRP